MTCDSGESRIRFSNPKKWNISIVDLQKYSSYCGNYIKSFYGFLDYLSDLKILLKIKDPEGTVIAMPKIPSTDDLRLLYYKNYFCGKSKTFCNSEVLLNQYYVGLLPKVDLDYFDFIRSMAISVKKNFSNPKYQEEEAKKIEAQEKKEDKKKLRILTAKQKMKRRILYPVFSEAKKGFSQLWEEYNPKQLLDFDINKTLIKDFSMADTKLPRMKFRKFHLFRRSKRCPLAQTFKGEVRVK